MSMVETAKWLSDGSKVSCIACGRETVAVRGFCKDCQTPLELSRSVSDREKPVRFVSVLGGSGAGKTVYLGVLLDILSRGTKHLRGLPNGPFSVAVQQETVTALERRRFPEKTPSEADGWQWVHCEVRAAKRPKEYLDVITPDFAGEAIAMEVDQPGTYPAIRSVVGQSHGMLILVDSRRARDAGRDEDFFALKLASYISGLHDASSKGKRAKLRNPIAIVFTKSDVCPEAMQEPAEFAAGNLPGMSQFLDRSCANYRFFAGSVVGSSATAVDQLRRQSQIPFHVQPYGILEPLQWIMDRI